MKRIYSPKIIEIFIILFPIIEAITSILKKQITSYISVGIVYKAIFIVYSLLYLLYAKKDARKNTLIVLAVLLIFSVVNIIIVGPSFTTISNISKLYTFVISSCFFYYYIKSGNEIKVKTIVYCALVYCLIVKISQLTGTQFATYRDNLSYGTKGWFYSGNELSGILSIFLPITFAYTTFHPSFFSVVVTFLQIHTMLSIGTKTTLIVVCIVLPIYLIYSIKQCIKYNNKKTHISVCLMLVVTLFTTCIIRQSPSYIFFVQRFRGEVTSIKAQNEKKEEQIIKYEPDMQNFLLNGRDEYIKDQKILYCNSTVKEKLFGLQYENRIVNEELDENKFIEVDILDIAIMFGIFGVILFYAPIVLGCIRSAYFLIKFKTIGRHGRVYAATLSLIIAISISCVAGHIFTSSTICIFVALINSYILNMKIINGDRIEG